MRIIKIKCEVVPHQPKRRYTTFFLGKEGQALQHSGNVIFENGEWEVFSKALEAGFKEKGWKLLIEEGK